MRLLPLTFALILAAFLCSCSCVSTVERERLIPVESREEYCRVHPECRHIEQIRNGEIIRGMIGNEVIASWGMPNVYLVSKDGAEEYWIYYVQEPEQHSVMIYSLCFDEDNVLSDWEIDLKRFQNYSIGYIEPVTQEGRQGKVTTDRK
jgi:hypothetical protein